MPNNEIDTLLEMLKESWQELAWEGDGWDGFETVDKIEGDDRRWSRNVEVITRGPSGQHYKWEYEHGLTEYQENEFYGDRPIPVQRVEKTITRTVVTWEQQAEEPIAA